MLDHGRQPLLDNEARQRQDLILTATLDCIAQKGLEGTRLKDVAAAAQVSVGTIQYYFDTKDELVLSAFRAHSEKVIARVNAAGPGSAPAWMGMQRMLHDFVSVGNFNRRTKMWVEFVAAATRDERIRQLIDEIYSAWRKVIHGYVEAGSADGTFSPRVAVDIAADALLAQMDGLEIAQAIQPKNSDTGRLQNLLIDTASALLGVHPAVLAASSTTEGNH